MSLDAVAARPPSDWKRILVLVLLALFLRGYTIANTTVPSRDCIVFVRDGLQLETPPPELGSRLAVLRKMEHPPGYPTAIIAMAHVVRPMMGGESVRSMALSAQLVSSLSGVSIVLPLFWLTRRVFDRHVAFAALALFIVLPVNVEVTSDGISDGLFLLTAAFALWFTIKAHDSDRSRSAIAWGLLAGFSCGAGYLLRPDAAIVGLACGLTFLGSLFHRLRTRGRSRLPLVAGLGLVLGTAVIMGPYVAAIGKLSNKPAGEGVINVIGGGEPDKAYYERKQSLTPHVRLPLAVWWDPVQDAHSTKSLWAVKAVWSECFKAAHYSIPFFALIGLWTFRSRLTQSGFALIVLVAGIQLLVLFLLAWKIGYVSQRHTLLTVMMSCILAAASLPVVGGLLRRDSWKKALLHSSWREGAILALLIMATALPRDFRSLHRERAGHKAAGEWLAENGDANVPIVDPFGWTEWYAGRTLREWPNPNPQPDRDLYLVFEPNANSPHSRLGHYDFVRDHYLKAERVYQYPTDAPPEAIKVAVYRFKFVSPPRKKK